jgi:hypothetical protein
MFETRDCEKLISRWPIFCQQCDSSNTTPLYSAAVKDPLDVVNAILDKDENSMMIVRKKGQYFASYGC